MVEMLLTEKDRCPPANIVLSKRRVVLDGSSSYISVLRVERDVVGEDDMILVQVLVVFLTACHGGRHSRGGKDERWRSERSHWWSASDSHGDRYIN